jgi:hypothetical protein
MDPKTRSTFVRGRHMLDLATAAPAVLGFIKYKKKINQDVKVKGEFGARTGYRLGEAPH